MPMNCTLAEAKELVGGGGHLEIQNLKNSVNHLNKPHLLGLLNRDAGIVLLSKLASIS